MSHPEYLAKMMSQSLREGDLAAFAMFADAAGFQVKRLTVEQGEIIRVFGTLCRASQNCLLESIGLPIG